MRLASAREFCSYPTDGPATEIPPTTGMIAEIILFGICAVVAFPIVVFVFVVVPFGAKLFWTALNDADRQYVKRHGLVDLPKRIRLRLKVMKKETLEFDEDRKNRLQKAYDKALVEKKDMFVFEGHEFVTKYAKYVLEYLNTALPGSIGETKK